MPWRDRRVKLSDIRKELLAQGAYQDVGPALYHGRKARLQVAETTVILHRPARKTINLTPAAAEIAYFESRTDGRRQESKKTTR